MEIREELENIYKKYNLIIGVDEVGRGCLAGPVVSCAIIMKKDSKIEGVTDSKKLSKKKRLALYDKILEECGIQYNRNGTWILYAKYAGKGYTKSETEPYEGKDGSQYSKIHTKWTQKCRMFLYMELQKHNIFPTMDLKK